MKSLVFALAVAAAAPCALSAQLPSPSVRALGMGESYTAAARGYSAVAWNPALLAAPGAARSSFAFFPVRGIAGLRPIGLNDLSDWQGQRLPNSVREQWLRDIERLGRQEGGAGGDATMFAAQIGPFGFQASSTLRAVGDLTPGAAELLFFGNAGRTGEPRDLVPGGSELRSYAASTFAIGYGFSFGRGALHDVAIGVTAKYTIGHMLLLGGVGGSTSAAAPAINVSFPIVSTSTDQLQKDAGSGVGIDVGITRRNGALTLGATIHNAISTFAWDEAKLEYREGLAQFERTAINTDFHAYDFANAPDELKRKAHDARFARSLAAGISLDLSPRVTVAGDWRMRLSRTTLADASSFHLGSGAEYRVLDRVAVRGGAALIDGGYQVSGGAGVRVGPMNVGFALMRRNADTGSGTVTMVSLFSTLFE